MTDPRFGEISLPAGNWLIDPLLWAPRLPSGKLCVRVRVAPDSEVTVPFALTWYFPQIEFEQGTRWWRRYTECYPANPGPAFEIAKEASRQGAVLRWEQNVVLWMVKTRLRESVDGGDSTPGLWGNSSAERLNKRIALALSTQFVVCLR